MSVQLTFQGFRFTHQSCHVGFGGQVVGAKDFQDFSVLLLVILRGNSAFHMVFPPFQSRSDIPLLELRVTLGHFEGAGNGVVTAAHEFGRVIVVRGFEEGSDHDNIVHAEKVGIEGGLQGIILRNVLSPILHTLGGLHFQNRGGLTVLVVQKVVPHTAEDFHIREEIAPSLLEVIGTPYIGRSDQIAHEVGFLHVLSLFRLNGLTGEGVDRVLEGLLVGTCDFTPYLEGSRPRVQAENGGKPGCRQLLRLLGRNDLNTVVVEPFHYSLSPFCQLTCSWVFIRWEYGRRISHTT